MRKIILSIFCILISIIILISSSAYGGTDFSYEDSSIQNESVYINDDENSNIDTDLRIPGSRILTEETISKIKKGMTIQEVVALAGPPHTDLRSYAYPFSPCWKTEDGYYITMSFTIEGLEDAEKYYQKREEIYADADCDEFGIRKKTEKNKKLDEEWEKVYKNKVKLDCAYYEYYGENEKIKARHNDIAGHLKVENE